MSEGSRLARIGDAVKLPLGAPHFLGEVRPMRNPSSTAERAPMGPTLAEPPVRQPSTPNPYTTLLTSERGFSYAAYRRSQEWAKKRAAALERADHRCQVCNSPHELEVHHRTYERLCKELPSDLTVLCATCHGIFHHGGRILGLYVEEHEEGVAV